MIPQFNRQRLGLVFTSIAAICDFNSANFSGGKFGDALGDMGTGSSLRRDDKTIGLIGPKQKPNILEEASFSRVPAKR